MTNPDDAFTAGAVRASDELLDRLGRRRPTAGDLDDPVSAALALFAGEVDLDLPDPAPLRRILLAEGLWPPVLQAAPSAAPRTGSPPPRIGQVGVRPSSGLGEGSGLRGGHLPAAPRPRPPGSPRTGIGPLPAPTGLGRSFPPARRFGLRHWDRTGLVLLTTGLALMAGGITLMFTGGLFGCLLGQGPAVVPESTGPEGLSTRTTIVRDPRPPVVRLVPVTRKATPQ